MSQIGDLQARGVIIPEPSQIKIAEDVKIEHIEAGVILNPGIVIQGSKTMLGSGSILGPGGFFQNVRCGRNVKLGMGTYSDCVFLDHAEVRSGAEIRSGTLFLEGSQAAHTVGCKMTILGIRVILGSLINFCDVFVSGGTDEPFGFTEIGSGAIHYNFTPNGLKFGSLIGPGAYGEMYGLYPKTFIGGQTQIIAPTTIGAQVLIPAGTAVRQPIPDGVMAIASALPPGQKNYYPELLTSVKEKILLTAQLIFHLHALARYFAVIRAGFAAWHHDDFATKLYQEAQEMIQNNIQERLHWLFSKKEQGVSVCLISKLPSSLSLHQKQLQSAFGNKIGFHLAEIQEHQVILKIQDQIQSYLAQPFSKSQEELSFLATCEMIWQQTQLTAPSQYLPFILELSPNIKQQGQQWLQTQITQRMSHLQQILQVAVGETEIQGQIKQAVALIQPHFEILSQLEEQHKFLWNGDWNSQNLGILNHGLNEYSNLSILAWQLLGQKYTEISQEFLTFIFKALQEWPSPCIFHWPTLLSCYSVPYNQESAKKCLQRAALRFHGTDGLRGPIVIPDHPLNLTQALQWLHKKRELTPVFMESLVRNSIYAYQFLYPSQHQEAVLVGCDPRDIYAQDPQRRHVFYQSVLKGASSTGKFVYDVGIVPIPLMSYLLACCNSSSPLPDNIIPSLPVRMAIYKTASHNPASQDGIKLFVCEPGAMSLQYVKASWELETAITALIVQESLDSGAPTTNHTAFVPKQICSIQPLAVDILRQVLNSISWNFSQVEFIAVDLAHGAFGMPLYQNVIREFLESHHIPHITMVGNHPDGRNINNNHGQDRVGAAHLENIRTITHQEILTGSFFGFPALQALFDFGSTHREMLQQGHSAWAIFTDGDGDRSYVALYDPWKDELHLMDGDLSFYHQIADLLQNGIITPGQKVAFTLESSVPFIIGLEKLIAQYYPVQWCDALHPQDSDKVGILRCAVGDKNILKNQCYGTEASGHIVKPYVIPPSNVQKKQLVFAGNGIMASLFAISAIVNSWTRGASSLFAEQFIHTYTPYPTPYNNILYIYFVKKHLWHRNSLLWQKFFAKIKQVCQDYIIQDIYCPEEEDTLYLSFLKNNNIQFAILARSSGTENKFAVKFFGTAEYKILFDRLSDDLYLEIALELKDDSLKICRDEWKVLDLLAQHSYDMIALEEIAKQILSPTSAGAAEFAQWMALVEAMSEKCQKLAVYNGTTMQISERGLRFWRVIHSLVQSTTGGRTS